LRTAADMWQRRNSNEKMLKEYEKEKTLITATWMEECGSYGNKVRRPKMYI
jgi:hypothetical protein